ncbi:MAG TPA: AAA domain-containing protein [Candidatus Angelobacter sp.]|nr:AAA domain-containing protein [Candidatus Angelobacter sp.]
MDSLRVARDKIARVFRYLEALNQHRNPVQRQLSGQQWSFWLHDLPSHPSTQRGVLRPARAAKDYDGHHEDDNFVLKVRRPKLSPPPDPPREIVGWLKDGWDDPAKKAVLHETRKNSERQNNNNDEDHKEKVEDAPSRSAAFDRWATERDTWATNEKPARAAMKLFEALYDLHGRLEREAEQLELMVGDGILSWRLPEGNIYHPILLQRLQLEFNAAIPEFILSETEHPVELYSALFQSLPNVDGRTIGRYREELEKGGHSPLSNGPTTSFLKRLVVQLSPRGEMVDGAPEEGQSEPCIGRGPVVFLRQRTLGFAAAIEGILEDLRTRRELSPALLNIVGEAPPVVAARTEPGEDPSSLALPSDVLLSKPANPEQIRIAQQLEKHGRVLVQGPPGTGKTHTIGNLIGHLLAQGKSVLVTSHTTKALRMVRHHIVPELRPLCVSVLESDLDSRRQLESAVAAIAERLGSTEAATLEQEARTLEVERHDLLKQLDQVLRQLAEARADEYREIIVGEESWKPAEAARKVTQEEEAHGWIPGPVQPKTSLPLSSAELSELYRTNDSLSPDDEQELSADPPDPESLPAADQFEEMVRESNRLRLEDLDFGSEYWLPGRVRATETQIENLQERLVAAVEPLSAKEQLKMAVVYAGMYGGIRRQPWEQLIDAIKLVHSEAANCQEAILKYGPVLPENAPLEENEQIAGEILQHLELGGKLNSLAFWRHKNWRRLVAGARVNGGQPRQIAHFEALRRLARLKILRRDLAARWDRQVGPLGAPASNQRGEALENTLIQFCDLIQACLSWQARTWAPLQEELQSLGFLWDKFITSQPACAGAYGELSRIERAVAVGLEPILFARLNRIKSERINDELSFLKSHLEVAERGLLGSKVTAQLADAARGLDSSAYRKAWSRLMEIRGLRIDFELRRSLLNQLAPAAPAWAECIRNRKGVHGDSEIPGVPGAAWIWRQLNDELEGRAKISMESLQGQSERLRQEVRRVTVNLIDRRAWAFQARRTSPHQRQALIGWLDTIRRIGKGTGIRVPLLRTEAARKMSECRGAVPVWVMPLSRLVENFDPRVTRFDVVIIDEASQSDVMALIALYLGKSVLVVGDHEQVSPTPVGQDLSMVGNLISQYLHGIPNSHLYDGQISIYDLARQSFGGTTCLVEHFRCVPEIIQFSNMVSYDSRVKPLRDTSSVIIRPPLVSYRVFGSSRDEKVNHQEALTITSLIAAAIEQPEYQLTESGRPVSFGVVSLIGDEQAIAIDSLLRTHLSPDRYEMHRLLCGSAAQFQGDERDVIFISLIDTTERGPLRLRDQQIFKQRFNVAASRARDQMWIVHSLDPGLDLKPGDLRRQLIEHAYDPSHLMRALEDETEKKSQSPFQREVMKRMAAEGYRVTPQWRVGKYRIDLVVEGDGDGKRLAIECEGDPAYPMDLNQLPEEMERQATLERLGWVFTRVRATEFFRDPVRAMHPVFDKLQSLEILPERHDADVDADADANKVAEPLPASFVADQIDNNLQSPPEEEGLVERVIRRAEELRQDWSAV